MSIKGPIRTGFTGTRSISTTVLLGTSARRFVKPMVRLLCASLHRAEIAMTVGGFSSFRGTVAPRAEIAVTVGGFCSFRITVAPRAEIAVSVGGFCSFHVTVAPLAQENAIRTPSNVTATPKSDRHSDVSHGDEGQRLQSALGRPYICQRENGQRLQSTVGFSVRSV